jgi:hypothetical protein
MRRSGQNPVINRLRYGFEVHGNLGAQLVASQTLATVTQAATLTDPVALVSSVTLATVSQTATLIEKAAVTSSVTLATVSQTAAFLNGGVVHLMQSSTQTDGVSQTTTFTAPRVIRPRYLPPTKVKTLQIPWKVMVLRADPGFEAGKRKEPFYEFSNGRTFNEDTAHQGPYSTDPNVS